MLGRVGISEFGAEQHNLRRVIEVRSADNERVGRTVSRFKALNADIPADHFIASPAI
jgi:hypothetical protein